MTRYLTPEQIAVVRSRLADAEGAYHRLMTGLAVNTFVDQNGEQVRYTMQNKADLYNYILGLKAQLPCGDTDGLDFRALRPMQPLF